MSGEGVRPWRLMRRADRFAGLAERAAWRGRRRRRPGPPVDRDLAVVVARIEAAAPDVAALDLTRAGGGPLPAWQPGAHLDVVLPSGRVRQYSLCGDPADGHTYRIAVRRIADGDGGSREVHDLAAGTSLTVRGPRNAFPLVAAPAYLFLAGGIGITPIAPMIRAAAGRRADWRLVHTGRDRTSMPLSPAMAALHPGRVCLRPDDEYGGPPSPAELLGLLSGAGSPAAAGWARGSLPAGAAVYCCGPPPMIDAVRRAMPPGHGFHAERFSAPPVRAGRPFTLELARRGVTVEVAADRSALDVVREIYPDVAYSCRQGFCGTCHVAVLDGATTPDTAAPGRMALCIGRAAGDRVVVEL